MDEYRKGAETGGFQGSGFGQYAFNKRAIFVLLDPLIEAAEVFITLVKTLRQPEDCANSVPIMA